MGAMSRFATLLAGTNAVISVRDPEDGSVVGEIQATSATELERCLARAASAVRSHELPAHERARILDAVAQRVHREHEQHAQLIATEGIKTIREARGEVSRCVETLRLSAAAAKNAGGDAVIFDQAPGGVGRTGWWVLKPAGVVAAITPFNDPLNLVAHKLGPAFALGAPAIVKPHPQTPFSACRLVEHFLVCGAPPAMMQIVFGGAELGAALVADPRVRVVSFTGGRAAGAAIAATAGIKRLLLELGGVALVAVAADADVERAASAIHAGAFWAAGQNCVHAQRIVADTSVVGELRDRLLDLTARMRLGPKRDEATDMGPLVDSRAVAQATTVVEHARRAGARVLTGGRHRGNRFEPTWLDGLPEGDRLLHEEFFAPLATIEVVHGLTDLLKRLAAADDAIHTAIFTSSLDTAADAFDVVNSAALIVNDSTDFRIDAMPFGGVGAAGLGREGIDDAMAAMAEKRLFVFNRARRSDSVLPG